jgi:hypothetical protein
MEVAVYMRPVLKDIEQVEQTLAEVDLADATEIVDGDLKVVGRLLENLIDVMSALALATLAGVKVDLAVPFMRRPVDGVEVEGGVEEPDLANRANAGDSAQEAK